MVELEKVTENLSSASSNAEISRYMYLVPYKVIPTYLNVFFVISPKIFNRNVPWEFTEGIHPDYILGTVGFF
jgi:hypothetical protein